MCSGSPAPITPASRRRWSSSGCSRSRASAASRIGREAFLERVWTWKAESGGTITRQLRRLGASLDWPRERFTMDEGLSAAVREVFVTLYKQGLIYRDRRLVNWDPKFQSAISDLEVENREVKGISGISAIRSRASRAASSRSRPPGPRPCSATPGLRCIPTTSATSAGRRSARSCRWSAAAIPIVADTYSDPEKGTGAVKITPAHDFNDFGVGQRHGLPMPSVLDREAPGHPGRDRRTRWPRGRRRRSGIRSRSGRPGPVRRAARDRRRARTSRTAGEDRAAHASGAARRPLRRADRAAADDPVVRQRRRAREARDRRRRERQTVFVPKQWENTFFAWMRDIQPWCISRQLWWGHRIPAWYGPDGTRVRRAHGGGGAGSGACALRPAERLTQDEDVLDTWFSSALWPFSTLAGRKRPRSSRATIPAMCWSPASTSSSSGSRG